MKPWSIGCNKDVVLGRQKENLMSQCKSYTTHGGGQERCQGSSGYGRGGPTYNLLQLMHQDTLAVLLKYILSSNQWNWRTNGQAGCCTIPECTRVFRMVHHDRLALAVSCQVSPQQEGETALECFEPRADFSSLIMYACSGIFFRCGPVSSILNTPLASTSLSLSDSAIRRQWRPNKKA